MAKKSNQKFLKSPLFIVAAAFIIIFAIFFSLYSKNYSSHNSQPASISDETADWKTYEASSINLAFKYPSNFKVNEINSIKVVTVANFNNQAQGSMQKGEMQVSIQVSTDNQGFTDINSWKAVLDRKDANGSYYNQDTYATGKTYEDKIDVRNEKTMKINGFDAIYREVKVRQIAGTTVNSTTFVPELYLLDGKGNMLIVQGSFIDENANYFQLFNELISTFKFTDSEGIFCGGFAGKACPEGYTCNLDGNYPDAGGKCIKQ